MEEWKYGRKLVKVQCKNCGIEFDKAESEYKRSEKYKRNHFCSRKCVRDNRKNSIIKHCKECGKQIINKDYRVIFCSHNCSARFNNRIRKRKKCTFSDDVKRKIQILTLKRLNLYDEYIDYQTNPKHCKECRCKLEFKNKKRIFCSINCKRIYDTKHLTEYQKYHKNCSFNFNLSDYPNEFDFELIKKYGWYQAKNHGNNLNGVSRDHMISIMYGYENNIDHRIISHPANCQLMRHNDNSSKRKKCSLTLNELQSRIIEWNKKYK